MDRAAVGLYRFYDGIFTHMEQLTKQKSAGVLRSGMILFRKVDDTMTIMGIIDKIKGIATEKNEAECTKEIATVRQADGTYKEV